MTSVIDNDVLLTLVEAWEAQTERLRSRRLGSGKKAIIQERERIAGIARDALPVDDGEASYEHFNRYIAGDR